MSDLKNSIILLLILIVTETYSDNDKIFIQGGHFVMGSDICIKDSIDPLFLFVDTNHLYAETPAHSIYVNSFYISKYETTNKEYCSFLNENKDAVKNEWIILDHDSCRINKNDSVYTCGPEYENRPVLMVTWYGALAFCDWKGGRLPTEAEWEYAAIGGSISKDFKFSGSNQKYDVAIFANSYINSEFAVGTRKPNELGIYDMSGNVNEWCYDWYDKSYYVKTEKTNPKGPKDGVCKVIRGGSWNSSDYRLRNKTRWCARPDNPNDFTIGFRCAFDALD